jgi:hypothetical protein
MIKKCVHFECEKTECDILRLFRKTFLRFVSTSLPSRISTTFFIIVEHCLEEVQEEIEEEYEDLPTCHSCNSNMVYCRISHCTNTAHCQKSTCSRKYRCHKDWKEIFCYDCKETTTIECRYYQLLQCYE